MQIMFAISAVAFAIAFLSGAMVYGGHVTQGLALTTALVACYSQFIGQDVRVGLLSRIVAYGAFALSSATLVAFWMGA